LLYVHYMDAHDHRGTTPSYQKGVAAADAGVGRLLEILEGSRLLEDALFVLTSDHGERLEEIHPIEGQPRHNGNPSFEYLIHVPLIVSPPVFPTSDSLVRTEDVFRMILDLAGVDSLPAHDLAPGELFLTEKEWQTYRKGRWKAFRSRPDRKLYLFDLEADPDEQRDVAASRPGVVSELQERMEALARRLAAPREPRRGLSEDDADRLRALGYLE
jgi:arylsulfatase A-like enzyme